jgi:hypothetical protein
MAFGYAMLARAEGGAYGVGATTAPAVMAQRVGLVTLFWLIVGGALGWLLYKIVVSQLQTEWFIRLGFWLYSKLELWSIPFVIWLLSPLPALFWLASSLGQVLAIRTEDPIPEVIRSSIVSVFSQPGRIVVPIWLIVGASIFVCWLVSKLFGNALLEALDRTGWAAAIPIGMLVVLLSLPFWFVLERGFAPAAGVEDDLDAAPGEVTAQTPVVVEDFPGDLKRIAAEEGETAAARRLANWIRARVRPQPELALLMGEIGDRAVLVRELTSIVPEWLESNRNPELIWLIEQGLRIDPRFLMDLPERVLMIAKRLTFLERSDLALPVLLAFLNQHRAHHDHLPAGLQLARVLATHANNADGARKLLTQLSQLYPDDPQVPHLLRQLGTPSAGVG